MTNLIWLWDVQDLDFNWAPYNPGGSCWDALAMDLAIISVCALLDGKLSREAARERNRDAVLEELASRPGDEPNRVAAD